MRHFSPSSPLMLINGSSSENGLNNKGALADALKFIAEHSAGDLAAGDLAAGDRDPERLSS